MERRFIVETPGERLDRFLAGRCPGLSRGYCKELIARGLVTVDGAPRAADHRLAPGAAVRVKDPERAWSGLDFESWVLHEDADILVLDKPPGILVHPMGASWLANPEAALGDLEPNLAGLLIRHRPRNLEAGLERCGIVHRLDRQTSGVWVAAKRREAQDALLEAFRERTVRKVYRAVVLGDPGRTIVDAPVGRPSGRRQVRVTPFGKEARTEFKTVAFARGLALVEARPRTGRTHQIRAHLAHLGAPVLGDSEWFGEKGERALKALGHPAPPRMLLHAYQLRFAHPRTGKPVSFTAPVPPDLRRYWKSVEKPLADDNE